MAKTKKMVSKGKPFSCELKFKPMEGFGGGFRAEWVTASWDNSEAGIDSGGGMGNPFLTFWIEEGRKERRYYTADIRDLFKDAISKSEGQSD